MFFLASVANPSVVFVCKAGFFPCLISNLGFFWLLIEILNDTSQCQKHPRMPDVGI